MKHVIVVGAGIAGLAAALRLVQSGLSVTLLEANDRVGGRIRTAYTDGLPVELGAEFVHGKPPELLSLLEELGLDRYELEGETITYSADGRLSSNQGVEDDDNGGPFTLMERMTAWSDVHPEEDLSFTQWLAQEEVAPQEGAGATGYVEGFNAADAGVVSVRSLALQQRAEDSIEGDTSFHVEDGYSALTATLADRFSHAGGTLRLNSAVQEIRWQQGSVCALTSGETVEAGCALITLPLGVLQSDTVRFVPAPGDVLAQAQRMRMGNVCRISLRFKRRWWAELPHPQHGALQKMSFLIPMERLAGAHFNVFWTGYPSLEPVLTAWSGGPTAASFDGRNDHVLAHIACGDLARIFGLTRDQVLNEMTSHHHHDWSRDPLSQGAYSWVPAGAVDASEQMSLPVENTLFFAGEHTDTTGHWGTVHGALRSGLRAAEQVINMLEHA